MSVSKLIAGQAALVAISVLTLAAPLSAAAQTSSTSLPLRDVPQPQAAAALSGTTVTTTEKVDGYHVSKILGIVRGVRVFQPTIGQNLKAGLKGVFGGSIAPYADMCEKARQEAYDQMVQRATTLGANAIVGVRFDSSGFTTANSEVGTEVMAYGTAVILENDR